MATHCPRNAWQYSSGQSLTSEKPCQGTTGRWIIERLIYESRVDAVYHEPLRSTAYVVDVSKIMCHEKTKVQDVCGFSSFGTPNRRSAA